MSTFYSAYFVKKPVSGDLLESNFRNTHTTPESEWVMCNWSTDYEDDLFEAGHQYTTELSAELGEVIFLCEDEGNDQMEYEHSLNGEILRKLTWVSDGSQSSWACVEGEKEDWEDAVVFSQNNFDRCSEMLKYDKHLNYLPADEYAEKIRHLKAVWDKREYMLESQLPLGDGTIPGAIIQHLGLPRR